MGGYAYRYRHEDVSASEAVSPPEAKFHAAKPGEDGRNPVKVILMFGSWNKRFNSLRDDAIYIAVTVVEKLRASMRRNSPSGDSHCVKYFTVQVDEDDMCLDICTKSVEDGGLEAPPELPCLLLLAHPSKDDETNNTKMRVEHVECSNAQLERLLVEHLAILEEEWPRKNPSPPSLLKENLESSVKDAWSRLFDAQGNLLPPQPKQSKGISIPTKRKIKNNEPAVRIFVAGDKSQVGKSSICMGLLGALLKSGKYAPSDLAYIKPATQCEAVQLVEEFCKHKGITACVPVGPIVYYKGFTRSFLKGETGETSADLLQKASEAVDTLAAGKKVVIIDGVGYPAVGSITGTDNASVARASGRLFSIPGSTSTTSTLERAPVPVLLIGKSGVGDAIDSFNINATYFSHQNVPVLGAIFNKMNLDGFYSLANCKEAIDLYFDKYQNDKQAFGYIPEIPMLKNARENVANISEEDQLKEAVKTAELFVEKFAEHVNVDAIVDAARKATTSYIESSILANNDGEKKISGTKRSVEEMAVAPTIDDRSKYPRLTPKSESPGFALSREQIEAMASAAGAAGG